jgi:hypothetical protein
MKSKLPRVEQTRPFEAAATKTRLLTYMVLQVEGLLRASRVLERKGGQLPAQTE